jgi:hypothetical protein
MEKNLVIEDFKQIWKPHLDKIKKLKNLKKIVKKN